MKRFRTFRTDQTTRDKYADVALSVQDFIYPYFVVEGEGIVEPVPTMPGINRYSIDTLVEDTLEVKRLGIDKVLLFGVVSDDVKDERGTAAYADDSLIVRAVRAIKQASPQTVVFTDVCLCGYTSHGHCGMIRKTPSGRTIIDN